MLVDTHAHLYSEMYENIDEIINNAICFNVGKIINCADSLNTSKEIIEIAKKYNNILYNAVGIHPENSNSFCEKDIKELEILIQDKSVVAVGEIGLDFHYGIDNKEKQIEVFKKQLDLAKKYDKPVIIHSRESTEVMINILKEYNLKGIIHCFSGSLNDANKFIKLGYLLGIGGILTFKNSDLKKTVKNLDLKNLVLETDSPFLTPEPFRKYKNEPKYVKVIAESLSNIKEISVEELEFITNKNIVSIFDF